MEKEKDNQPQGKFIETYAEDMAHVIESDQGGLVKRIIEAEETKEAEKKNLSPESSKNRFYLSSGIGMVVLAFIVFLFFSLNSRNKAVPPGTQFTPIVYNDKSFFIETYELGKPEVVASILSEVRDTDLKPGGVEGIYLTANNQVLGLRSFLSLTKSSFVAPGTEVLYENFMIGLSNREAKPASPSGRDLFILLKVRSFQDVFESLRAWEDKMFFDLHGLFNIGVNKDTNYLLTKDFENGVIENKNARILYDKNKEIILMYVFADETSVIIARKVGAVREVISRLETSQLKK